MIDESQSWSVLEMMSALYAEDQSSPEINPDTFPTTIKYLLSHPDNGSIILMYENRELVGYSILIPFWSNECGGNVILVDELYVVTNARGRGTGRGLFSYIKDNRLYNAVKVFLEVSPGNIRARKLYESIGFTERTYTMLSLKLF